MSKEFDLDEYMNELVSVYIPIKESDPDDDQVYISINKYSVVIKRGREVKVPRFVKMLIDETNVQKQKNIDFRRKNKIKEEKRELD